MKMKKNLYDISWQVSEEEYREDPALSYSTLARFNREGFEKLETLFDKVESPSLSFGSAVDAIITGGQEEFDKNFFIADFTMPSDSIVKVVSLLFSTFGTEYRSLHAIPSEDIINATEDCKYQLNWKPETRVKVIREQGEEYYTLMYASEGRKIENSEFLAQVNAAVEALRTSPATAMFFDANSPFMPDQVREYQLKFKATCNNVDYRCMADLLYVDHHKKIVMPVDLKTSSHAEYDFAKSFVQWSYQIQARLYWRIIRANMDNDPYFKDFKLDDYRFIVVNKNTLTPLVWVFPDTQKEGELVYGRNKNIYMPDPFTIGEELNTYLKFPAKAPAGIDLSMVGNDIVSHLNQM